MAAIPPAAVQVPLAIQLAAVEYDVVVFGAGLSGLEAARNIHKSGLSVLVLGFIELGAAWINDTNQSEMWAMAQKYGLDTVIQRAEGLDCVQNKDKSVTHVQASCYRHEDPRQILLSNRRYQPMLHSHP
jgi:monoamine oxidase